MRPVTSRTPVWNFDMNAAPHGRKLLAINDGVAVIAFISPINIKHFQAWCPLPKIPKDNKYE